MSSDIGNRVVGVSWYTSSFDVLLEALDGVAYIVDTTGVILAVGQAHWNDFARKNVARRLKPSAVIGSDLFGMVTNNDVREEQRVLHAAVVSGRKPAINFQFRCDAPDTLRLMRMSLSPILIGARVHAVLYQSQTLVEEHRRRMNLFDGRYRAGPYNSGAQVTVCTYCHFVRWPPGVDVPPAAWVEPQEFYRRGGAADALVRHDACPACRERLSKLS